ncbi:alpha/beta hydrolase [Bacteroides xylanisolvens]|uniref:alpha/beta hydrolase n=1 Tax=Bacteroides xylanisolvens TaxID=371601 RepID=UPI00374E933F
MNKLVFALLFALLFWEDIYAQVKAEYVKESNVAYRKPTSDKYMDSTCLLDIIYPSNEKKGFSTLIWFHGGSLKGGSRHKGYQELLDQGFAVVTVDYRLSPKATVVQCLEDAAAATAWVVENISRYGGNPKQLFLGGHSAGGYLVSMLGLDKRWLAPYHIDPDTTFAALIPYSGQSITHFTRRAELDMPRTQPLIDDMSPLYHVRKDCPPIMILSGDRELEMLGRYEENAYFWRMFQVVGHPNAKIYEFDSFSHGAMQKPGHLFTIKYIHDFEKKLKDSKRQKEVSE